MMKMFSLTEKRMLIWVFTLVIVPLGLINFVTYYEGKKIITEQNYTTFNVMRDSLKIKLLLFIENKKNRITDFTSDRFLRDILIKLDKNPGRIDLIDILSQNMIIDKASKDTDIFDILIFNKSGKLLSSTQDLSVRDEKSQDFFINGRERLFFKPSDRIENKRLFGISAPIRDLRTNEFLGVIAIRFNAASIDNILDIETKRLFSKHEDHDVLEMQERIFIVDQTKTIIFASSAFLLGKKIDIEPVEFAFGKKIEASGEFTGIFGKERLGASLLFNEPELVLIMSISKDKALSPVKNYMIIGFLRIGIGMVLVIFLVFVMARKITKPIVDIAETAERVAKGNWDERVVVKDTKGEIAQLARAFNEMIETLQRSFQDLKQSEGFNEKIVLTIPSGLIILDKNFRIQSVNKIFVDMFGLSHKEISNIPVNELLRDIGISEQCIRAIMNGYCFSDLECECNSPVKGDMTLKLNFTNIQDAKEIVLLIDDITESRKAV